MSKASTEQYYCTKHHVPLFCPRCIGGLGGRKTAEIHKDKLSAWGKRGGLAGRGRKHKFAKRRKRT